MGSLAKLAVILKSVNASERNWKNAEDRVTEFDALDSHAKQNALPATIEKLFPLIFGDAAAIEGSVNFEVLKSSTWLVLRSPGIPRKTS